MLISNSGTSGWKIEAPQTISLAPGASIGENTVDILPRDLHTKIQVCMSVRLAVRVVTHRHTDTHRRCQNYYTLHVTDGGCKTSLFVHWTVESIYWIFFIKFPIFPCTISPPPFWLNTDHMSSIRSMTYDRGSPWLDMRRSLPSLSPRIENIGLERQKQEEQLNLI